MTENNTAAPHWWGKFEIPQNQTMRWDIGSMKFAVQCLPNEWRVAYSRDDSTEAISEAWSQELTGDDLLDLDYGTIERFVFGQTGGLVNITPVLADRPIVTRPLLPFYVPPEESSPMFVSTPLWIRIDVNDPPLTLQEFAIRRPSDTWFGPSTMEGELCYGSRTHGYINYEKLPVRYHRAITKINIQNRATTQLLVDRISLPVPYLSLYESADNLLWTETVTMLRSRNTGMATFQVEGDLPPQAQEPQLVSSPRQALSQSVAIRAFGALFR